MTMKTIDIGRDFSPEPAGRFPKDGTWNGESFRVEMLVPALKNFDVVEVVVDNTEGFGSSFLEEAFGGLIRVEGFLYEDLARKLEIKSEKRRAAKYKRKIEEYLVKARDFAARGATR